MKVSQNKVISLKEAITQFIKPGCHLSVGGFTINRNPMAAVYEIIRQRISNIHLYAHSNGQAVDELIGGGCVSKLEIAYGGNGKFASTCIRFKKAIQENTIKVEDYSNYQMTLRFLAGAMGVPFLPTRSSLGTDIVNKWGFSREMRNESPEIPDKKLVVIDNPFTGWLDTEKVVLIPAITPDVTIIHVQQADKMGNCRIQGLSFADVEQAKAAKHVIITCETLFEEDELKQNSHENSLPFIHVDAVVHAPNGAYPTACFNHYDYDPLYLKMYARHAKEDGLFSQYLDKYIFGVKDYQATIDLMGDERMSVIKADPRTGYAANLDRS